MRTTNPPQGYAHPKTLTLSLLTVLSMTGLFGAHAGEAETASPTEATCLSCAYEDGLPAADRAQPFSAVSEAGPVGPGSVVAARIEIDTASFDRASSDRARLILPTRRDPREHRRWSKSEKALMWSFVSLSAIDAYQTMNAPGNVREANPLLSSWAGDHPGTLETVLFKGATTYGMLRLADRIEKRSTRRLALALMNVVQLSVAAHNEQVTGGVLF